MTQDQARKLADFIQENDLRYVAVEVREESRPAWYRRPCPICGFRFGHAPDCRWPALHAYYAQMGVEYD